MLTEKKKEIFTGVHSILRGFPAVFGLYFNKHIDLTQLIAQLKEYKTKLDLFKEEADNLGGYFSHYIGLIHSQFMLKYIFICEADKDPEKMLELLTEERIAKTAYHMQWSLLDLIEAEINRPDVPNAPPYESEDN